MFIILFICLTLWLLFLFTFMSLSLSQWMNWLMAAAGTLWQRQCVFMSCSSCCRVEGQVRLTHLHSGGISSASALKCHQKVYKCSDSGSTHRFSASYHFSHDHSGKSLSPLSMPLLRCLRVCQQHAVFPVDPGAAVHQPRGSGASVCPLALPLPALASGPQDRWRAEKHRPRHLLH